MDMFSAKTWLFYHRLAIFPSETDWFYSNELLFYRGTSSFCSKMTNFLVGSAPNAPTHRVAQISGPPPSRYQKAIAMGEGETGLKT
jgi:hypothetical protein